MLGGSTGLKPAHRTRFPEGSAACLALLLALGCGDDATAPAPSPAPVVVEEGFDPRAAAIDDARAAYDALAGTAHDGAGTVEGVAAARRAAEIAAVLAQREPGEGWLERARLRLEEASRQKSLDGSCEAANELAGLLARELDDPQAAYTVAYRTARRFDGGSHADCVTEARRITSVLEPYAPPGAQLAAIDEDPDRDDPGASADTGASTPEESLAAWAEARGLSDATLEGVSVYGAPTHATGGAGTEEATDVVRVVMRFDHVAVFRRAELAADGTLPRRAYIDFARTTIGDGVPASSAAAGAGLVRVRVAAHEGGVARVVFDLEPDAHYHLFFLADPYRVVVDFDRGGASPVAAAEDRDVRVVVIDPGHGGNEFGARHEGLTEAVLTLDIARRVEAVLHERLPGVRVLLTRRRDEVVSLEERVAFANSVRADAFVSIHLNAADDPVDRGGVTTFVLDTTDDSQALRLAARENGTRPTEVTGLERLLARLERSEQVEASRGLATLVQHGTLTGGRRVLADLRDRGVKSAMFYVLVGARMPAVLVEASFLNQEEENHALATDRYRQALAEGIGEGIARWALGASPSQ